MKFVVFGFVFLVLLSGCTSIQSNGQNQADLGIISNLNNMAYELNYNEVYIFTFSKESCETSCVMEFDVFVDKFGAVLGWRITKEFIVETI